MNTAVAAWLWAAPGPAGIWLPEIEAFFGEVEAELSRFRPDSGLSRLNAAAGQGPQPVSPMLAEVLRMALEARDATGGIFDPTVLPALKAAGYDRSFELLGSGERGIWPQTTPSADMFSAPCERASAVVFDRAHRTVELPPGVQIDLGGIAKGWTVDRAAELLGAWGPAMVDAGGDIRATEAPGGELWPVAVEDPFHPEVDLAVVRIENEAIATSSVMKRSWSNDGRPPGRRMHHLIDPRTGEPAFNELVSVTAIGPTTVRAETAAKVALILGRDEGRSYISEAGLDALFVDREGRIEVVGRERFEMTVVAQEV